jgi:FAD/FMN-containing dehydrogenase
MTIGQQSVAANELRTQLRGQVVTPEDRDYPETCRLYNAMIERRPAVVARCTSVADVVAAVKFARARGLDVAIRGGGHNGAGLGSVDGGLVVDLRAMRAVQVDPGARTATVEGGALIGELDQAAHAFGLATRAPAAPEDVYGFFAFLTVPPVPPFPAALHRKKVCGIVWCCTGSRAQADDVFAAASRVATPALHGVQEVPYPGLQSAFDPLYPPGDQWYWRGDFVEQLPDAAIAQHLEFAARLPSPQSTMHLYPVDGAAHRVGRTETAFSHREANWSQVIVGVDRDPARAADLRAWTIEYWDALHPYSAGGAYVNFMMEEGQERVRASYRENYDRLARVKAAYDPENLFHVNQNVRPAA